MFNYTKRYFFIVLAMLPLSLIAQQQKAIKGKVVDEKKLPIIGASIIGETAKTQTDEKGEFAVSARKGERIAVSYLGFNTANITIDDRNNYEVTLTESSNNLSELVVFGYGKVQKKDLTGAIESIGNKDLQAAQVTNVTEALNGRVSGVLVTKANNRPGSDMGIQIRGQNSFNFSGDPLFVIDGVPSYSGMKQLNAADIESIDVLKDASSSAIYGSRGANGVVIVTTKAAGRKQGLQIDYTGSVSLKTPTRIPNMIGNFGNGMEYVDYKIALWKAKYGESSLGRSDFLTTDEKRRIKYGEYYDWLREISNNAYGTNQHISAVGNTEKSSYSFGIGYNDDNGMVGNEDFKRYTVNLGLEHRISSRFKVGLNSYLSLNKINNGADDALLNAYFIPPIASPYDKDGNYAFEVQPTSSKINPFVQIQNNKKITDGRYINLSGFTEFVPIKDLTIKSQFALQADNDIYGEWVGKYTQAKGGVSNPDAYRRDGKNLNYVWDNIATYNKKFSEKHALNLVGLFSVQKENHEGGQMRGIGLPFASDWYAIQSAEEITDVSTYYWEAAMVSYMLRANYTFSDKYLLTLTGRYDGSSKLSTKNRWGFMPSAALAWRVSNEEFMKNQKLFNDLKLRVSWGKSGNNNINYDVTYSVLDLSKYTLNGVGVNGYGLSSSKGNPDLKWEMTSEWNYGLDFSILKNRISGTVDVYSRTTKDLIFRQSVADINGYSSFLRNIGSTGNRGVEISLNSKNIKTDKFTWNSGITFTRNRNRIIDLYGSGASDLANRWFIGQPIRVIYDLQFLGIWQEEEKAQAAKYGQLPGHIKVADLNGDGFINENDFSVRGTPSPDYSFGFTNNFSYKNWDLSVFTYGRIGGLYNDDFTYMFTAWDNEHWNKLNVNYWTPQNRSNSYPQVGAQSYHTQVLSQTSGTFVKIQNITLGYRFNENLAKKLKVKNLRINGSVTNPFTFTKYLGPDPEIIGENVTTQLSLFPMTFNLGINLSF